MKTRNIKSKGSRTSVIKADQTIDYKDLAMLRSAISSTGKLQSAKSLGCSKVKQREVARAVKRARFLALVPYCDSHK